ncbi:hypothetical protein A3762_00465 [Oleiphilus sp. HI0125]|uniref:hypothetical protein n=1 Tax=Oleiphilus sp. HI0125 TaxID=1822266 RepID=UPI0007C2F499|nr:hypothetical protein [Oleiphilus sp. HI0125]KZZ59489.1 hypothetical protein A3762_00465 [Oleiphilus sp. HI0125]
MHMLIELKQKYLLGFLFISSVLWINHSSAEEQSALICKVDGSDDAFKIYTNQRIYESEQFEHYQLIDGLTVLVVNKDTMKFNRLSNLNLLAHSTMDPSMPPEPHQFFSGECSRA